jgi:hypothetical protein
MTDETQGRQRNRKRLWWALALVVALLVLILAPPYISISRYKSQITHLMAASLGRPVRLSSVQLRLLPRPGFVLTDLTVEEDPAFGAEPVLHADTVTASFRFFSLWRGRIVISRISVDDASVNLVRNEAGSWNLDALMRSPAIQPAQGAAAPQPSYPLPTLVATNSRINIKNGAEKLPFSLVDTDVEFWQTDPGAWRIQLRGQPARTDVNLNLADTGVVRLDASLRRMAGSAPSAVHLDMDWREAQLGQLARLITGSDPGWRGDLTGEVHLDGTTEEAQIKSRLRATGVHRAEFAPVAPMDFDANCTLVYRRALNALDNLACDSPLGDGRVHLAGNLPGMAGTPHFSLQLDRVPITVGLDALRTIRGSLASGLEAKGSVSGKMTYVAAEVKAKPVARQHGRAAKAHLAVSEPLTGSFTVEGLQLSGDALSTPLQASKFVLEPTQSGEGSSEPALAATITIPAGGAGPLTIVSHLAPSGYQLTVHGQASVQRAKELARLAGMASAAGLDSLAGDPVAIALKADGPWMPAEKLSFAVEPPALGAAMGMASGPNLPSNEIVGADSFTGAVTLHNANWKADYLANHVMISQATLHLSDSELRWDPVEFSYGPLKATATITLAAHCEPASACPAKVEIVFGDLDSGELQAAILGAHERGTLLSELLNRLHSSAPPSLPAIDATVKADSLVLGPVTLNQPAATLRIVPTGAEISGLDANLLGGQVHATGTLRTVTNDTGKSDTGKPAYAFDCKFDKLSASAVGQLLGMRWTGGAFDAEGKIDLAGFTAADLSNSAKGTLHFEWHHGQIGSLRADRPSASSKPELLPAALARFDRWTADAEIANGIVTLKQNQVVQGARRQTIDGAVVLAEPLKVTFTVPKETEARR